MTTEAITYVEGRGMHGYPVLQHIAAHEFGHAFGNAWELGSIGMTGDEYYENSRYYIDRDSIMHSGNSVRRRHYAYIRHLLEERMPGTVFKTAML